MQHKIIKSFLTQRYIEDNAIEDYLQKEGVDTSFKSRFTEYYRSHPGDHRGLIMKDHDFINLAMLIKEERDALIGGDAGPLEDVITNLLNISKTDAKPIYWTSEDVPVKVSEVQSMDQLIQHMQIARLRTIICRKNGEVVSMNGIRPGSPLSRKLKPVSYYKDIRSCTIIVEDAESSDFRGGGTVWLPIRAAA